MYAPCQHSVRRREMSKPNKEQIQAAIGATKGSLITGYKLEEPDRKAVREATSRTDEVGEAAREAAKAWRKANGLDI